MSLPVAVPSAFVAWLLVLTVTLAGCDWGGADEPAPTPGVGSSLVTLPATAAANPQFGLGGLIVFDGDSLTYGTGAEPGADYPSDVMRRLPAVLDAVNIAVPGQTWSDMLADADLQVDPLQSNTRPHNVLVAWAGTNDVRRTRTAARVWSELQDYCSDRRDRGWTVVLLTVLPNLPRKPNSLFEEERQQLNDIIRERWPEVADALADVAADPRVGDPAGPQAGVYCTDGIHHNAAGNRVIAEVVAATLRPLVGADGEDSADEGGR